MTDTSLDADYRVPEGAILDAPTTWLSRCVGDAENFLGTALNKAPYLSRGDSGRFDGMLSRAELSRLMAMGMIPAAKMRLVKHDAAVPTRAWAKEDHNVLVADGERIERLISEGCTLVINGVDRYAQGLFALCRGLQAELSYRLGANIYLSPPFSQGFSTHFDEHDVIVLQLEGEKDWQVFGRVAADARQAAHVTPSAGQSPIIAARLRKGDCLYVPSGYAHCVASADQPSLHASIGIHPATVADLVGHAVNSLAGSPALARPLPPRFAYRPDELGLLIAESVRALDRQLNDAEVKEKIARAVCRTWIDERQRASRRVHGADL